MLKYLNNEPNHAWLAVGARKTNDKRVLCVQNEETRRGWSHVCSIIASSIRIGTRRNSLASRFANLIQNRVGRPERLIRSFFGHEDFDFPGSKGLLDLAPEPIDLLHCHNLHGDYFDLRCLPELSGRVPVVFTLHDAWLLSGHCVHSFNCERWKTGCGKCPDLTIYPSIRRDATAYNWRRKRDVYRRSQVYIATPSRWLMDRVEKSMLFRAIKGSRVIPNGIDLEMFSPGDSEASRQKLALPLDARIILASANGIRHNPFKDYEMLRATLEKVRELSNRKSLICVVLGQEGPAETIGAVRVLSVPYQSEEAMVVHYYRAADVYLHPTKADTFPTTILESMACGTPVVASAVGGVNEQIVDGITGYLVPPGNSDEMAQRTNNLLCSDDLREAIGTRCREHATRFFGVQRMVIAYFNWYQEIIDAISYKRSNLVRAS